MSVTVIVPTYNGATKIPIILDALKKQSNKDFQLLVILDGSTDNSKEILAIYENQFSNFKIVEQTNKGRAAVRNTGAKEAIGELLIFLDDDMQPDPNCLEQHMLHHQQFSDSILVGAQIDPTGHDRTEFQLFKSALSLKWAAGLKQYAATPIPKSNIYLTAANFSISKKQFDYLSGFDERLTDAEDYDLAVRAQKANIPLFYNHNAFAWHYDNVTCQSYIKRMRQYATAHQQLIALNPEVHGKETKYTQSSPRILKKYFCRIFCFRFWIRSVDNSFWKWLPRNIRYKLYDWIITSNGSYFTRIVKL